MVGEESVAHDAPDQSNVEPHGPDAEQSGRGGFGSKPPSAHRGLVPDLLYLVTSSDVQRWEVGLSHDKAHGTVEDVVQNVNAGSPILDRGVSGRLSSDVWKKVNSSRPSFSKLRSRSRQVVVWQVSAKTAGTREQGPGVKA